MNVGRNDPCPCGSGKKYKQCCLAQDEAAARQEYAQRAEAQRELARGFVSPAPERPPLPELPPPDPLDQARGALWEEFEAAEPAERLALFRRALAEREVLDANLAFEMVGALRDNHGRAVFASALDALLQQRPELYERDAPYYLDWQIGDALATGNLAVLPELASALAATAGQDLDTLYIALDKLAYHGQLVLAAQMMALAWPHVGEGVELVPWAKREFAQRALNLTLLAHFEQNPGLRPDDPQLITALEHFAPVDSAQIARHIALLAGRVERRPTLDDFAFRRPVRHDSDDAEDDLDTPLDPAVRELDDLSLAFLGALYRDEGVSLARGELARKSIVRYILERHAGKLKPAGSPFERGRRPKGSKQPHAKRRPPAHLFCPDRETLDRFLAEMLNFISPKYYDAAATLELTPVWLRFLEACELLSPEQHVAALSDLHKLVADAAPIWEQRTADPAVGSNIRRAWDHR